MARDGRKFGKDARDRARHRRNQRGAFRPMVGGTQRAPTLREVSDPQSGTRTITREDRYDLSVPHTLGDRLRGIHVKTDVSYHVDTRTGAVVGTERHAPPKLVLVFRKHQEGIRGLPVPDAAARKLRKFSFTHVVLQRIPPEAMDAVTERLPMDIHEERGFRITWFAPKSGHKHRGEQGGEVVHDVADELSVLQWLYEHDLLALYDVPHLASQSFLPMRDEDRSREDELMTRAACAFGLRVVPHPVSSFHFARLHHRLLIVHGGNAERAEAALAATVRGNLVCNPSAHVDAIYYNPSGNLAYGVCAFPSFRVVVAFDLRQRTVLSIQPILCDADDYEELGVFNAAFLQNPAYRAVTWDEFCALIRSVERAAPMDV